MTNFEAVDQYKLLIHIVSEISVFQDVDWEQEKHIEALETLRRLARFEHDSYMDFLSSRTE